MNIKHRSTWLSFNTRTLFVLLVFCARPVLLAADEPAKDFYFVDLQPKANQKLDAAFHDSARPGNNLAAVPRGEQTLMKVKFSIGESCIQLYSTVVQDKPKNVDGLELDVPVAKLHILHGTGYSPPDGTRIGQYTVHYADKTNEVIPIVYGEDVRDWWDADMSKGIKRGQEAWRGTSEASIADGRELRLYKTTWENPHPEKDITKIDFTSTGDSAGAPFCLAITAELK